MRVYNRDGIQQRKEKKSEGMTEKNIIIMAFQITMR